MCQYFAPEIGAPSARLLEMSRVWVRRGHRVTVVTGFPNHPTGVLRPEDRGKLWAEEQIEGIRVLRNSQFALRARSSALWVVGVDDLWWRADDLAAALRSVPARDPKILLCHNPVGIRQASEHGIDFVLSGHTHGGQVRLPVVGSVYGRSKLGERFVEGWNRLNGTQIYVSRGIGKVLVPIRFGCPPEIACLRLRRP